MRLGDSEAKEITASAHKITAVIPPWTKPTLNYLINRELPEDKIEVWCIVHCSKAYTAV